MKKIALKLCVTLALLSLTNCVEPYTLQTNTFEDFLVVEASITNEFKQQEIKLSRTYKLEQGGPNQVLGATVLIIDNLGTNYPFTEINGRYLSNTIFQAEPNRTYQLRITTNNGRKYSSTLETLTAVNPIQNVLPNVVTKSDGKTGIEMVVTAFDPTNSSKYYRYEFEETYKIISPLWTGIRPDFIDPTLRQINLITIPYEARICYSSKLSNKIIQTNTNNLSEDKVEYPVQFVDKNDYKISNRYSIIVKQYVQNLAAFTYYKTLNEISGSSSILTQNQPGFLYGNLNCDSNPEEKVIGYFEVASFSSKRIFLNYSDYFSNQPLPPYPFRCVLGADDSSNPFQNENYKTFQFGICNDCDGPFLLDSFNNKIISYYNRVGQRYNFYPIQCGDCTSFSSNIRPLFWID